MVHHRSPGGPTIINTVLLVITNVIDYKMNIQQAVDAPRIHHQWLPDQLVFEPYGLSGDTQKALLARGHKLAKPTYLGNAEAIMIEEKPECVSVPVILAGVTGWRWVIKRIERLLSGSPGHQPQTSISHQEEGLAPAVTWHFASYRQQQVSGHRNAGASPSSGP